MKKITLVLVMLFCSPAFAEDFYYQEYVAPDAAYGGDYVESINVSTDGNQRDNYIGMRLHKNERISFAFDMRSGGGTTLKNDGVGLGVYVGNRLTDFLKVEFETLYNGANDTKRDIDFDFDIWSNMVNVYLYQTYGGAVEPYAGVGLGFSTIWSDVGGRVEHAMDTTFDFSYSVMVGVNFALNDRVNLDLGFKYQKYGDADHKASSGTYATTDIDATEFYIGAAYKFGLK